MGHPRPIAHFFEHSAFSLALNLQVGKCSELFPVPLFGMGLREFTGRCWAWGSPLTFSGQWRARFTPRGSAHLKEPLARQTSIDSSDGPLRPIIFGGSGSTSGSGTADYRVEHSGND